MRLRQELPGTREGQGRARRVWNRLTAWERSPVVKAAKSIATGTKYSINIRRLDSARALVRKRAAAELGEIGDERAVRPLIQKLEDPDWNVQEAAAKALGKIGDERAVGPLIKKLNDLWESVQEAVVEALARIGEPVILPLIGALKDPGRFMRKKAKKALLNLAERYPEEIIIRISEYINGNEGLKLTVRCEPNDDAANALNEILLKCGEKIDKKVNEHAA